MQNYNFLILSPPEFENLTRDLLQKQLDSYFESFSEGQDGGIDLRASKSREKNIIVQCKRYKDFKSLYNNLKKEVPKVEKLKPNQYIITTSVGLNPNQKDQILNLFKPYLKETKDIYGRDDLNNLIGIHKEIETKYAKLWLSSVNVLDKILHSKIYNQSQFEIEKINEVIKLYVQNESYHEAIQILNKNQFVVISGIPGIGKTTLARILTYHLLSIGFEEFVYLNSSIEEGYTLYHEEKKQVFLFDDFLGKNFLETSRPTNEENAIIRFIDKIKRSNNKALIFATREYILNQATLKYEVFSRTFFDENKCIIDLSKYTKLIKAKILYNHLFFSDLPNEYIRELFKKNFYLKLISHSNYSPRIIEVIINSKFWKNSNVSDFRKKFKRYFDFPESIWEHAYNNHISELSRCTLALIFTAGTPIIYDDLLLLIQSFAKQHSNKYNIKFTEREYKKSLRELENSFIITNRDYRDVLAIEYQNPSIQDFLVNYLKTELDFIKDILESSIFVNQLFRVFSFHKFFIINGKKIERKNQITLKPILKEIYVDKVLKEFDFLNSSSIIKLHLSSTRSKKSFIWNKKHYSEANKLQSVINDLILDENPSFKEFIQERFLNYVHSKDFELNTDEIDSFINLLKVFRGSLEIDIEVMFEKVIKNFVWYQDLHAFTGIETIYPEEYEHFINSNPIFQKTLTEVIQSEYESAEGDNLEEVIHSLEQIENNFGGDAANELEDINKRLQELEDEIHSAWERDQDIYEDQRFEDKSEDDEIISMFETLKQKK